MKKQLTYLFNDEEVKKAMCDYFHLDIKKVVMIEVCYDENDRIRLRVGMEV